MIDTPADYETATNATPQRYVKNRISTNTSAVQGFTERGHIRIVIDKYGKLCEFAQPSSKRKVRPTFNLMGTTDISIGPINWTAEPNADRRRAFAVQKRLQCSLDLLSNARAPKGRINRKALTSADATSAIACHDLKFRSTDLDAEVILHSSSA